MLDEPGGGIDIRANEAGRLQRANSSMAATTDTRSIEIQRRGGRTGKRASNTSSCAANILLALRDTAPLTREYPRTPHRCALRKTHLLPLLLKNDLLLCPSNSLD